MARYRRYVDRLGIATVINLDAVASAKMRDRDTIYVRLMGGDADAEILRVTIDAFLDHLTGDDQP